MDFVNNYGGMQNGFYQQNQSPEIQNFKQIQQPLTYGNGGTMYSPYNYMGVNRQFNNGNNSNQFLKCRPVSSKDEAKAYQIDLDGSLWVFTDLGNQKIYTKQINNDGTAMFKTYTVTEEKDAQNFATQFVTKQEFDKVTQSMAAVLQSLTNKINEQSNVTKQRDVKF